MALGGVIQGSLVRNVEAGEAAAHNQQAIAAALDAVTFPQKLAALGMGVEYYSDARNDGISNEELLRIHAEEGVTRADGTTVIRDIRPNDSEVEQVAQKFADTVANWMAKIGTTKTRTVKGVVKSHTVTSEQANKQAGASALKACAVMYQGFLQRNIVNMVGSDGSPLAKVVPHYAEQRQRKYQIAGNIVFQRTGKLINAVKSGRYRMFYDRSKIDNIKRAFAGGIGAGLRKRAAKKRSKK